MRSSSIPTGTALGFMVLFACALITAPASTVHAQASPSFNCDGPGANLQTKIDGAPDGATIFFGGTCDDGPYIISRKNINLRGFSSGGTLSAPADSFAVVAIFFAHVGISRLDIDATGDRTGIQVTGGTVEIIDVVVQNSGDIGIELRNNSTAFIFDSRIEDSTNFGIVVTDSSSADIGAIGSPAASQMITGNGTQNDGAGVLVDVNSSVTLRENFIEDNGIGVVCGFSGALTVEEVQDFGTGNTNGNADVDAGCHLRNFSGGAFP